MIQKRQPNCSVNYLRPKKPYCILLEYYKMPEKTVKRGGSGTTRDYHYDEDGYFHFVDRKKDAIRRRGENISSFEVEKVIRDHPAVLEPAAIGEESELGEDEVMVCLTLKPGTSSRPKNYRSLSEKYGILHGSPLSPLYGLPAKDPNRASQEI
jgi:crotonobetaine/carnitine-CoA ligase